MILIMILISLSFSDSSAVPIMEFPCKEQGLDFPAVKKA
jgi:hypothetical protein